MDEQFPLRPYGATWARPHGAAGDRPATLTVDCHGHMQVPEADELVRPHLPASELDAVKYASPDARDVNRQQNLERMPLMEGVEARLREMDRMGVDVQVLSPVPAQFNYQADPGLCAEASQIINDRLAEAAASSDRLAAIGTVPLQDCGRAVAEMERCIKRLGMPGVEIGAGVGDGEIADDRLDSFWASAEELGAAILVHPTSFASDRLSAHYLTNVIGNPLETTVAAAHLIFSGVLDRYPGLRVILAHGGGYAASCAARMDHAWGARRDCRTRISRPPSEYLARCHFDTIVFAVDQLEFLYRRFGAERLLAGTDYAFDMGEYGPLEHVLAMPGIDEDAAALICGLNAARLFRLDPETCGRAETAGDAPKG